MNFSEYWYRLQVKNPQLCDSETKMTITVDSFKAQLKKAFDAGLFEDKPFSDIGGMPEIDFGLGDLFGGGK